MLLLVELLFYYFMLAFDLFIQSHQLLLRVILLEFLVFFHLHFEQ
jgi:hypothetical protein